MRHLRRCLWLLGLVAACGGKTDRSPNAATAGNAGAAGAGIASAGSGGLAGASSKSDDAGAGEGGQSDAGSAGASTSGEAGAAGATGWLQGAMRVLTTQATKGEWYNKSLTPGLLVAPNGHVFFETAYTLYEVVADQVSDYLTDVEAQAAVGNRDTHGFGGLGVDQHGTLYSTYGGFLIRLNAPHQVEFWRTEPGSGTAPALALAVLGENDVIALGTEGMWRVTAQAPATSLKSFAPIDNPCPDPRLTLDGSGTFLLQRSCTWELLERGSFDGSMISDISTWFDGTFPPSGPSTFTQFLCAAADPQGGFYVVVKQGHSSRLYYLTDDATETTGISEIAVSPSLDDAAAMTNDNQVLQSCNLAATTGGTLYLQTSKLLWKLTAQR